MKNTFLEKHIQNAKENYNYFFIKLIFCIVKVFLMLLIVLLINCIIDITIINIITLLYTFYSMYKIITISKYYTEIINDIKNTLGYDEYIFEVESKYMKENILKSVVKYGK